MKVFIPVSVNDELPIGIEMRFTTKYGETYTGMFDGEDFRNGDNICPKRIVESCLVAIELPTAEELKAHAEETFNYEMHKAGFIHGSFYILNLLTPCKK